MPVDQQYSPSHKALQLRCPTEKISITNILLTFAERLECAAEYGTFLFGSAHNDL